MKLRKCLAFTLAAVMTLGLLTACGSTDSSSTADSTTKITGDEQVEMRDISSVELVKEMKIGWNLGNTMDSTGTSDLSCETSWGNVETTKEMIDTVKAAGFNVFRLPVSWGMHMDHDYTVDAEWMARVREIVNYGIDNDMFVILNTHHEEWYFPTEENKEQDIAQLTALWTQIAEEFKNYDEHLIFEGLNEPRLRDTAKEWTGGDDASREIVNEYENAFYTTVRNSGGNNAKRHLMITPYAASSDIKCMQAMNLPDDDKIIVSIHAYLPYSFALDTKGTDTFDATTDGSSIDQLFTNIDSCFLSKGVAVIVGEFGSVNKYNVEDRVECAKYYLTKAKEYGVPCVWWDNGGFTGSGENFGLLVRSDLTWSEPTLIEAMTSIYA